MTNTLSNSTNSTNSTNSDNNESYSISELNIFFVILFALCGGLFVHGVLNCFLKKK
jgi:hypothetical protein